MRSPKIAHSAINKQLIVHVGEFSSEFPAFIPVIPTRRTSHIYSDAKFANSPRLRSLPVMCKKAYSNIKALVVYGKNLRKRYFA